MENKDSTTVENDKYCDALKSMQNIKNIVCKSRHMHKEILRLFTDVKEEILSLKNDSLETDSSMPDHCKFLYNEYAKVDLIVYNLETNLIIGEINKFFEK